MQIISRDINVPLNVLDVDVAASATVRTNVFLAGEGTGAYAVELRVTLLGSQPVNLTLKVLGQLSTPAADPTRLMQLSVGVPDMSALAADYARLFVLPVFAPFQQLEFTNVSGGNVHVQVFVQGCDAEFVDAPAAAASGGSGTTQLLAGSADAGTFHLATGGVVGLSGAVPLPTGASTAAKQPALGTAGSAAADVLSVQGIASMTPLLAILQAGANAIGKLAANVGINIGTVDVASLPSLVLAAGANAIGKLAANVGVNIGTVDVAVYAPFVDTVASADTSAHAYGTSQAVKAPVFVRVARSTTGTVTVGDGTHTGMALTAGDTMPLHCTNLNQLSYQFSVNASATEKFSISAAI